MEWYIKVLKNYANFKGRARRREYWMFVLFNFIFAIVAFVLDFVLGTYMMIYGLYLLATLVPSLAVLVRRLHDVGKSGGWFFIILIPLVGAIWMLVLLVTDGTAGDNPYGPSPKAAQ